MIFLGDLCHVIHVHTAASRPRSPPSAPFAPLFLPSVLYSKHPMCMWYSVHHRLSRCRRRTSTWPLRPIPWTRNLRGKERRKIEERNEGCPKEVQLSLFDVAVVDDQTIRYLNRLQLFRPAKPWRQGQVLSRRRSTTVANVHIMTEP